MAKWYGKIGFSVTIEVEPGVWVEDEIVDRAYFGDVMSNRWKREKSERVNQNINLSNQISILADPYARDHCSSMIYAEFMNEKWEITDVEVQYPRLILSIGGVFNKNSN